MTDRPVFPTLRRPVHIVHRAGIAAAGGDVHAAVDTAIRAGAQAIELDVRRRGDDVLVVEHGDLAGPRDRVQRQSDDVHAPPLADVLDQIAGRAAIQLDLREPGCERDALGVSHARVAPERLLVTSFLPNAIQTIRGLDPRIATGLIVSGRPRSWRPLAPIDALLPFRAVRACRADVLIAQQALDLAAVRPRAARAGVPLILWTVNDRRRLASALADDRLLGVVTDRLPQGSTHPGASGASGSTGNVLPGRPRPGAVRRGRRI